MVQLGSGSFGEVFTALWKSPKGEVKVAVKYFNDKMTGKDSNFDRAVCNKKKFLAFHLFSLSVSRCLLGFCHTHVQLQVLSKVYNHPNVVDLYGFGDNVMKVCCDDPCRLYCRSIL